jgi:hypothetical protein
VLGGLMFGVGMTLASGCGNKTLVRIGGGNLKSVVVLAIASACAYAMLWTNFYDTVFGSMMSATTINLAAAGKASQALGDLTGLGNIAFGAAVLAHRAAWLRIFLARFSRQLRPYPGRRGDRPAVIVGWYVTGGTMGAAWKEFADFADVKPLRVETQSFTFMSPMGDLARYVMNPADTSLINFGIVALAG